MSFIIQVSDSHLLGSKDAVFKNVKPYVNLSNVLSHIQSLDKKPELIILNGDNSQDGSVESYKLLKSLLDSIKIKYYILPGNHDDINNMNNVFGFNWDNESVDASVIFHDWHLYLLNSARYPNNAGELSIKQLHNLSNALLKYKIKPTIIFLHHQPVNVNSAWIDKMALIDSFKFNEIIKTNPQIVAVLFGHIHHVFEQKLDNIFYASAPSTLYQVVPNRTEYEIENRIPGYRLIELEGNKINSKVIWVK